MSTSSNSEIPSLDDAICIIGAGSFARAVGRVLTHTDHKVRMWARSTKAQAHLKKEIKGAEIFSDLGEAVSRARMVVFGVNIAGLAECAEAAAPFLRGDQVLLHGIRGVAEGFMLPHEVICTKTSARKIAVFGGPLYFDELKKGKPMIAQVASRFDEAVREVKDVVKGTPVKVHASKDVVGVELCGVFSNITHLATGLSQAVDLGETARGVLSTHGLSEAQILGVHLGANLATFSGLAGIADLIPRPIKATARHHKVAKGIVEGKSLEELLKKVDGSVEGVSAVKEAAEIARRHHLHLPLVFAVDAIMHHGKDPREELEAVLQMDLHLGKEALSHASS
ncbi:MAG: NAD(P)-binding domain-containing protein [Deltaproteobacteria bacterium]|nr:NAD(P)-binding domain-containing protein [Deltaproteobacteria bacterium]